MDIFRTPKHEEYRHAETAQGPIICLPLQVEYQSHTEWKIVKIHNLLY